MDNNQNYQQGAQENPQVQPPAQPSAAPYGYTPPQPMYSPPQYQPQPGMAPPPGYIQRSRIAAGILAIFLGYLGIHSFYLGNTSQGLMKLLISLLTFGIGAIVMTVLGILDGVKLLDGRINTDAYGVYLKD